MRPPVRKIHLHGSLGSRFGNTYELEVDTAGEAVRALACQLPGFSQALHDGAWRLVRGEDPDAGLDLELEAVNCFQLGRADLHIVPAVAGAKDGGAGLKTILGVALIGTAFALSGGTLAAPLLVGTLSTGMTWGNVAMIGIGLALSGAASMLSPQDKGKVNHDSFISSGPTNTYQQGGPVPLVYGFDVIVGGTLVSGGLDVERIAAA